MDRTLCHCLLVSEGEVLRAIAAGARTVDEVGDRCEAGTGCGSCRGGIGILLAEAELRRSRGTSNEGLWAQLGLFGKID